MHVAAIILAAGKGARFKSHTPKPLAKINSRPVISYSLKTFGAMREITSIVIEQPFDFIKQGTSGDAFVAPEDRMYGNRIPAMDFVKQQNIQVGDLIFYDDNMKVGMERVKEITLTGK